jgi:HD superfamily phosphohydrolase
MPASANTAFEVRCPLHGTISFTERERVIVNHPLVQRLRGISQLGFASLVFPGATHTRFSHSLGVMHLAGRVFDQIAPTLGLDSAPRERDHWRAVVRLAGLLHDLGHPPYSHTFEPLLPPKAGLPLPRAWYRRLDISQRSTHEDFSVAAVCALARETPPLISEEEARDICALIDSAIVPGERMGSGNGRQPALYPVLKQIISGEIDADRMDYLRRDAHFAGVAYGHFDLERLIRSLSSAETPQGHTMALDHGGLYPYENFLMARFHMAMQVYFHKTLLAFEYYLARAVAEGEIDIPLDGSLECLLDLREDVVSALLYRSRQRRWSSRIVNRVPMRRLIELHDPAYQDRREAILGRLRDAGVEFVHLREERRLSTQGQPGTLPVFVREDILGRERIRPLHEVSRLLERYNQVFSVENVYCDVADYDRAAAALAGLL